MPEVSVLDYPGTDPTGITASDAGFAAALAALGGAGSLYVPAGTYKIAGSLTWNGGSLQVRGDGQDASQVQRVAGTTPAHTFDVADAAGGVTMRDFNILNNGNAANFTDDHVALNFSNCTRVHLERVHVNSAGNRVNKAVVFDGCSQVSATACDLRGYVNALYLTGGTAVCDVTATGLFTNPGTGIATAGNLVLDGSAATVHCTGVETNGGDHGLVCTNGVTSGPSFVFLNDFEVNNCHGHGIQLDTGSQFWGNQLWLSNQTVSDAEGAYSAINVGAGYTGWLSVSQSVIQHFSGSGISLLGGQSYWITDTSFSGCGGHGSTYHDIYLAAAVKQVRIHGNNFDIEPFNTTVKARSGVCISAGATGITLVGNQFAAASRYSSGSTVLDPGASAVRAANIGA